MTIVYIVFDRRYIPVYTTNMFIQKVVSALDKANVRYALVGGYAVALHGAIRGTVDLDFVIALEKSQFSALESAMKEIGMVSRLPVSAEEVFNFRLEYIKNRNLIAWDFVNNTNPLELVDIIITHNVDKMETVEKKVGDLNIQLAAITELIKMKQQSARPQDLEDIKALKQLL